MNAICLLSIALLILANIPLRCVPRYRACLNRERSLLGSRQCGSVQWCHYPLSEIALLELLCCHHLSPRSLRPRYCIVDAAHWPSKVEEYQPPISVKAYSL